LPLLMPLMMPYAFRHAITHADAMPYYAAFILTLSLMPLFS